MDQLLGEHALHAAFVLLYLFALMAVGALKIRKIKTQEDFALAGRGLSTPVLVGTLLATWIGTGSIFGNAEKTYTTGLAVLLLPTASAIGIWALYFLAARVRAVGKFTIPDILHDRYGSGARILGALTLMAAYVVIVSYQYRAGSAVVEKLWPALETESTIKPAIFIVALFVVAYTALAGMFSVAYTDVANGVLMIIGIALALPILFQEAGGLDGIHAALPRERFDIFGTFEPLELIGVTLPTLLLLLGDANMYQRFFSASSPAAARRSAAWMFFGVLILEVAIILVAFLGSILVSQGTIEAPSEPGYIVIALAFDALPPFLGAMLVGTVVAIIVSTADSFLLAPATSFVRDVLGHLPNPPKPSPNLERSVVVALGLVALALSFSTEGFFEIALFAYTLYGAGITPPLMAAFFWKRATGAGAAAAIAGGVGTAIVWKVLGLEETNGDWAGMDSVLPATAVNIVVLIVVSLLTSKPQNAEV